MSAPKSERAEPVDPGAAVAALGNGPLTEAALREHVFPLFTRALASGRETIYLANHSLGRPPDRAALDVARAVDLWYTHRERAWEEWLAERERFRAAIAQLISAPRADCIVPKASAGQGLRAILNCYDARLHVVSTLGEFGSIDHILKTYAQRGRIAVTWIAPDAHGTYDVMRILEPVREGSLVVVSLVFFITGQWLSNLDELIDGAHARGALVLVDLYHAAGALPVYVGALDADFAIGGCYKYLRGGPGAAFLYIHPRHLDGRLATLDSGWFAQPEPFGFARPQMPQLARGGDAFLEATPAVLPYYQARAGLELTQALGVERLRAYVLGQQALLCRRLAQAGVPVHGDAERRGNFIAIPSPRAMAVEQMLRDAGIIVDAREGFIRLCPDILNTTEELHVAAEQLVSCLRES